MQNQEFSEEYYKMKYFKYRAKYEQLKEIVQSRPGLQTGGWSFRSTKPVTNPVPSQVPNPVTSQIPGQMPGQAPGQVPGQAPGQAPGQVPVKSDISTLMNDIKEFVRENLEVKDKNKYLKTIGKLEEPCSYKQLIGIVDNVKIDLNVEVPNDLRGKTLDEISKYVDDQKTKIDSRKKGLIDRIKKQCATTIGGLNSLCKLEEEVVSTQSQKGGYTLTPDSLDDINTEFLNL
jgi:hypothetical protein